MMRPESLPARSQLHLYYLRGYANYVLGDWTEAKRQCAMSADICRQKGSEELIARARMMIGQIDILQEDQPAALKEFEEVIGLARKCHQPLYESRALRVVGGIRWFQGQLDDARRICGELERLAREGDSKELYANWYHIQDFIYREDKRFEDSRRVLEERIKIFDELGDLAQKLMALNNLGDLFIIQDRWEEALAVFEDLISLSTSVGNIQVRGFGMINSAFCLIHLNRFRGVEERISEAYRCFSLLGHKRMVFATMGTWALLYDNKKDYTAARRYFKKAIEGYRSCDYLNHLPRIMFENACMEERLGNRDIALDLFNEALGHAKNCDEGMWVKKITKKIAELEAARKG